MGMMGILQKKLKMGRIQQTLMRQLVGFNQNGAVITGNSPVSSDRANQCHEVGYKAGNEKGGLPHVYPYTISFIAAIGDPGNGHAIGALECASRG